MRKHGKSAWRRRRLVAREILKAMTRARLLRLGRRSTLESFLLRYPSSTS